MSCQLDDIGCSQYKHNFGRQIQNPQLNERGLVMLAPDVIEDLGGIGEYSGSLVAHLRHAYFLDFEI